MELKDVILSTLAEMENDSSSIEETPTKVKHEQRTSQIETEEVIHEEESLEFKKHDVDSELMYLNSIRERLLVLFEGFQAPNNTNIEAKLDMTLNFLEYTLATIDLRVDKLEKGSIS
ncbi:hypothetical protein GJV85_06285 [Sulfurimonas aquatica]|uniref:Campylobacter invasion antigen D C-terminal domain-containing protein n=1 Tax=Sulfurimonas aquatica TaxID=2672570 RepID=A0A975B080_9BACT|nr:hypothetical protein [Sulfurimonas aquatica]QSZ41730.1 hypothetical protein GJV85_06285 [Sulfurimonas aquatica]